MVLCECKTNVQGDRRDPFFSPAPNPARARMHYLSSPGISTRHSRFRNPFKDCLLEKHSTLILLLADIIVLPHGHSRDQKGQNTGRGNAVHPLGVTPGVNGGITKNRSHGVGRLGTDSIVVDLSGVALEIIRQMAGKCAHEGVVVDRSRDSIANGTADTGEQTDQGQHHRGTLTATGGHDSHILANDQSTSSESDEDLAHNNVANAVFPTTEVDHQARAKEHQGHTKEQADVLEAPGGPDEEPQKRGPETRANVVDLDHVSSHGNIQVVGDQDKVVQVLIPQIEAEI